MTHSLMFRDDGSGSAELTRAERVETGGGVPSGATQRGLDPSSAEVPGWVSRLWPDNESPWSEEDEGWSLRVARGAVFDLVSVWLAGAVALPAVEFERAAAEAYDRIVAQVMPRATCHPVRLWNFIPGILDPLGDLPHRYMVFNAGRLAGFRRWLRQTDEGLWRSLATATGVGSPGDDLVVHCLTARRPGEPVENPRQCPAYRYSQRYGPKPPCFARATRIETTPTGRPWVLVGGTASVLGEHTAHGDDLPRQIDETFANLEALVGEALGSEADRSAGGLDRFRQLRVYHPRAEDAELIAQRIDERFPRLDQCELQQATLCRPDLRVEIEGVVE